MAKKITLTVPESLYSQINLWRSSFNLSRIFQEAVTEAIHKKEDFQKRVSEDYNLNDVVRRLKKEKAGAVDKLLKHGEKEGRHWASRAHYEELVQAVSATKEQLSSLPIFARLSKEIPEPDSEVLPDQHKLFLEGWKKGVNEFWEMVKDKI